MLSREKLLDLYYGRRLSTSEIARMLKCSAHQVDYWMKKYSISKRPISEAVYIKHNPKGDPFKLYKPTSVKTGILFGLGLGLYWGEGTKSNKGSVRLGNTDPRLLKKFLVFLKRFFAIKETKLKFGLQIFSDIDARKAKNFWIKKLEVNSDQFQKVIITPTRGEGNYRHKNRTGVLTIYYNNKKLRDLLCKILEQL